MANWTMTCADIEDLAEGCALLGSGGGGDSHGFRLALKSLLADRREIQVLDPTQVAADATVVNVGFVGAPVVMTEKLFCADEVVLALESMSRRLGRPIDAVMPAEIGGANGLSAFIAGALLDVPVVDADGMGRAFPMSDQITYSIYGRSASPTIATNEHGDIVCVDARSNRRVEQLVRALSVATGHKCFTVDYVLTGAEVRECAVLQSASLARRIGATIREARSAHADPLPALALSLMRSRQLPVETLIDGKVVDCRHETRGGFGFGTVIIESVPKGKQMIVEFQNEFLVARLDGVPMAMTPDIISIVDSETIRNIGSESVRYGQRVKVLAIGAPTLLRSSKALAVVGPRAFGIDLDYVPIGVATA